MQAAAHMLAGPEHDGPYEIDPNLLWSRSNSAVTSARTSDTGHCTTVLDQTGIVIIRTCHGDAPHQVACSAKTSLSGLPRIFVPC